MLNRMSVMSSVLLLTLGFAAAAANADVLVGGSAMFPQKNIVENAVNSKDHTTLVTAVKAAGLVDTLEGKGPFTVFAPVNAAFAALPAGTVDNLLKPENKGQLTKVLTSYLRGSGQADHEGQWHGDASHRQRRIPDADEKRSAQHHDSG
jgi:uncharacterized surface protein with fasciclin (FAS1) repeats